MARSRQHDAFEFYTGRCRSSLLEGNVDAALAYAARGYLLAVEMKDALYEETFRELMAGAIRSGRDPVQGQNDGVRSVGTTCCFCGRGKDESPIIAGAKGAICESCARSVFDAFAKKR